MRSPSGPDPAPSFKVETSKKIDIKEETDEGAFYLINFI
jgi:hypothetical protein